MNSERGKAQGEAREVGVAWAGGVDGVQGGEGAAAGAPLELQGEAWAEAELRAVGRLVAGAEGDRGVGGGRQGGAAAPQRRAGLQGARSWSG